MSNSETLTKIMALLDETGDLAAAGASDRHADYGDSEAGEQRRRMWELQKLVRAMREIAVLGLFYDERIATRKKKQQALLEALAKKRQAEEVAESEKAAARFAKQRALAEADDAQSTPAR